MELCLECSVDDSKGVFIVVACGLVLFGGVWERVVVMVMGKVFFWFLNVG